MMTIQGKKEIPGQDSAGATEIPDQSLSDTRLEQVTGGVSMSDELAPMNHGDDDDPGVDLDMVEGSIRLKPGSNVPVVDK
jgi:hypothetical protein